MKTWGEKRRDGKEEGGSGCKGCRFGFGERDGTGNRERGSGSEGGSYEGGKHGGMRFGRERELERDRPRSAALAGKRNSSQKKLGSEWKFCTRNQEEG